MRRTPARVKWTIHYARSADFMSARSIALCSIFNRSYVIYLPYTISSGHSPRNSPNQCSRVKRFMWNYCYAVVQLSNKITRRGESNNRSCRCQEPRLQSPRGFLVLLLCEYDLFFKVLPWPLDSELALTHSVQVSITWSNINCFCVLQCLEKCWFTVINCWCQLYSY